MKRYVCSRCAEPAEPAFVVELDDEIVRPKPQPRCTRCAHDQVQLWAERGVIDRVTYECWCALVGEEPREALALPLAADYLVTTAA